jgi:threonine dehydrogenase-like Zn-dependent dehydrogenase
MLTASLFPANVIIGAMSPQNMITKIISIDEVAEEGFRALIEDKDNQVKILVRLPERETNGS